jgi:Gpi18-like mannosyltransferase
MQTEKSAEATTDKEKVVTTPVSQLEAWKTLVRPWWLATLAVLPVFLITRLIFLLLTYFGGVLFFLPNYSTSRLSVMDVIYTWYQWDAKRFISIATQGYTSLQYAAFFPLFPTMERVLSRGLHINVLVAGMLISNLAFLGTLIILYRLTDTEFDRETAKRTVLYLSIFPTALFFFAAYNESLFLFFALASFYALRHGSWWLAGLLGFLATLTRSIGLFLFIIFLYEYIRQRYGPLRQSWQNNERVYLLRQLADLAAIVLIPLALILYAYGLKQHFGDALAFMHAQTSWRLGLTFPLVAPGRALKFFFTESPFTFTSPHLIIDLTALALFALLLILCFVGPVKIERHQWSFALFGFMALVYALLFPGIPGAPGVPYDPIPSSERFVLEIFIGFIILARLGRRQWVHQGYLLLALPMLAFLTLQFMTGHWTI